MALPSAVCYALFRDGTTSVPHTYDYTLWTPMLAVPPLPTLPTPRVPFRKNVDTVYGLGALE